MTDPSTSGRSCPRSQARGRCSRGVSLIEICVGLAVVGLIVALAWPSQQAQLQRVRRLDATAALTRLQFAQEKHRLEVGRYSADLAALGTAGSARSAEGWYALSIHEAGADRVRLVARPLGRTQEGDRDCPEITLQLDRGQGEQGPSSRCWNQ